MVPRLLVDGFRGERMGNYLDEAFDILRSELEFPTTPNELFVRYGTAVRTLDTFRKEQGLSPPDVPWDELTMCVALIKQIRNVFAHNTVEPKWDIKERYRVLYEFDDISISLIGKHGHDFKFDHLDGPYTLFALRRSLESKI